jgi:hypothetical protein
MKNQGQGKDKTTDLLDSLFLFSAFGGKTNPPTTRLVVDFTIHFVYGSRHCPCGFYASRFLFDVISRLSVRRK